MQADRSPGTPGTEDLALLTIADDEVHCGLDPRLSYSQLTLDDGSTRAILPLIHVARVESFNDPYRALTGLDQHDGPLVLVGGGLSQFRDGLWARSTDPEQRAHDLRQLVERAVGDATAGGATPITTFVSDRSLAPFNGAATSSAEIDQWCTLHLDGARELEAFLLAMHGRLRRNWRRDLRDAELLGLTFRIDELSDDVIREIAPGVASVSRRNGLIEQPMMAAFRMKCFRRRAGTHLVIRAMDRTVVVASTVCRRWGTYLEVHTIGIAEEVTDGRRSVYHFAAYIGPLMTALGGGFDSIGFGYSHEVPKLARGCRGTQMWRVALTDGGS